MFQVVICGSTNRTFDLFSKAFIYFWSTLLEMVREDAITLRQIESDSWIELTTQEKKYILHIYALSHLAKQTRIIDEEGIIRQIIEEPIFEIVESVFTHNQTNPLFN